MNTPHDRLFRRVFSDPEQAAGELRQLLPAKVSRRIDWGTLRPLPGTFVDEVLAERRSDLLFTVRMGGRSVLLYLLLEHQSASDPLMPFRLLRYMVRIWEHALQQRPQATTLPAIVPMVVHHSERGWRAPTRFEQLVDLDEATWSALEPHLPRFTLLLDDLSAERDEALRKRVLLPALARLSLLSLKWSSRSGDVLEDLQRCAALVEEVAAAPNGVAALSALVSYLLEVSQVAPAHLASFFRQLGPRTEEAYMTGAQILRDEGRAEGEARGEARALLRVLDRRGITLSEVERARIERCVDIAQLERWLDRALLASSSADLFA